MNALNLMERLEEKVIFRVADIERISSCSNKYAKLTLNRLIKRKLIKRVTKNVYTVQRDAFLVASNIIYPSYISFWSASYYLGYTEQIVNTIQVATTRKSKSLNFENYKIKFVPIKDFFGYKKLKTEKGEMFIAENEKLLIDCFLRYKKMGNFDEIIKVFENAEISEEKMIEYLKRTGNQTILKRAGYLLEKTKQLDIRKNLNLDNNYILLNPFSKEYKSTNTKWRIKE